MTRRASSCPSIALHQRRHQQTAALQVLRVRLLLEQVTAPAVALLILLLSPIVLAVHMSSLMFHVRDMAVLTILEHCRLRLALHASVTQLNQYGVAQGVGNGSRITGLGA